MSTVKRTRWLVPASFFLALTGGLGLSASVTSLRRIELSVPTASGEVAPDLRPGESGTAGAFATPPEAFARASVTPLLRVLRFAVLRCHSPPRS